MSTSTGDGRTAVRDRWEKAGLWSLAVLFAVLCVAAVHLAAGRFLDDDQAAERRADLPRLSWAEDARAGHPARTLTTRADFTVSPGTWQARVEHTLVLARNDPLLKDIRQGRTTGTAEYLDDWVAGDVRYVADEGAWPDSGTDQRWEGPTVTQEGPRRQAVVTWMLEESCRRPCAWDGVFAFTFGPATDPAPTHTRWTVELRDHGTDVAVVGVAGAVPVRQTEGYAVLRPLSVTDVTTVTFRTADTRALEFPHRPSAETGPRFTPSFVEPPSVILGIVLGFLLIGCGAWYGLHHLRELKADDDLRALLWIFTMGSILLAVVAWESPRTTDGAWRSLQATVLLTWWGVVVPACLLFLLPALHNVLSARRGDAAGPQPKRQKVMDKWTIRALAAVVTCGALVEAGLVVLYGSGRTPLLDPLLGLLGAVLFAVLLARILPARFRSSRVRWCGIAAVGAVAACVVVTWGRLVPSDRLSTHASEGWLLVGLGLLWVPALFRAVQLAQTPHPDEQRQRRRERCWWFAALVTGLLMYLPADILRAFRTPRILLSSTPHPRLFEATLVDIAFHAVGAFIVIAIAVMTRRRWHAPHESLYRHARTMTKKRAAALGVAFVVLTVNPVVAAEHSNVTDVLPVAAALAGFSLLLRSGRSGRRRARRLSAVGKHRHAARVRLNAQWALLQSTHPQLFQKSRDELVKEELSLTAFNDRWRRLGRGVPPPTLATGAGRTPWQNAERGAAVAFLLALPVMAIEWYSVLKLLPELTLGQLLALAEHTLRWSAYGAFFGYFFTRLPGRTPVIKAQCLLAALLVPELLLLFYPYSRQVTNLGLASGLRIGWLIVFCLVLGMYWEWHLVSAARVQWRLVRSFRSWSSLTAPVTAVVVAAATAVATVLAGAAAVSMTQQPTEGTLQQQTTYSAPGP